MLQLVIYVQDGESFFYDADEGQRIGSFKRDLGRKLDTTTPFKLMYENSSLKDDDITLLDAGFTNLGSVSVKWTTESDEMVQAEEMNCTVVLTEIPTAPEETTESALVKALGVYGGIKRIMLQEDGNDKQHAVVVFSTVQAATDAMQYNGREILGKPVLMFSVGGEGDEETERTSEDSAARVGAVLGEGAAQVKQFDEQHQISKKVKASAEVAKVKAQQLDQQYEISATLNRGLSSASETAATLDEKYQLSRKAQEAADSASATATTISNKAMENPAVASSVKTLTGIFESIKTFSNKAVDEAKKTVEKQNSVISE